MIDIYFGSSFEIYLRVPKQAIEEICVSGSNDAAVAYWSEQVDFSNVNTKEMKYEVDQNIENTETFDEADYKHYALWIACWDHFDRSNEND